MAGFTELYKQVDQAMAEHDDDVPLPMWLLLLFIAEPGAMRWFADPYDLIEARPTLAWSQWLWNASRLPYYKRRRVIYRRIGELQKFVCSVEDAREMVLRAQLWPEDLRVVTRATIEVDPTGEWRLDIATT